MIETWKFFDITHSEHLICNPTNEAKLNELVDLLRLEPGSRVLEIATGKGEFIVRLAERYEVRGVALDLSPYCIRDTREKLQARAPEADITLLEMDGADYRPEQPASFDLVACIGASWIFDGHRGTLAALKEMVAPGGLILVGEPFWRNEPEPAYLEAEDMERDSFGSHYQNMRTGEELGLALEYALVSSEDDWDRYEGLQWYASQRYALAHPEDPDVESLLQRVERGKRIYLKWGRETMGWALYLFRKAPSAP